MKFLHTCRYTLLLALSVLATGSHAETATEPGQAVKLQILQQTYQATVVSDPFYDPGNERLFS